MTDQNSLQFIQKTTKDPDYGLLAELLLPCGSSVTIREQNGNDDDILSSFSGSEVDLSSINRFTSGIIIKNNFSFASSEKVLTPKEVLKIPLKSKYFILMASRIFSLGNILTFQWDWQVEGEFPVTYEEDLSEYLWNYNKPFPVKSDPNYFSEKMTPYTKEVIENNQFELVLKSGKKIKYEPLTGKGENYLIKLPNDKRTVNAGLRARKLQIETEGEWFEVNNFGAFTAKEMMEIRAHVEKNDKQFDGISKIKNPHSGQWLDIPLLTVPDFFYPREI